MQTTAADSPLSSSTALSSRRLSTTTTLLLAGRVLAAAMGAGVAAVLARSLSHGDFGVLALALNLVAIGANLGDFGISQIAVREIAAQPEARPRYVGALALARLAMGIAFAIAGTLCAFLLTDQWDVRVMTIAILVTLPLGASTALTAAARGRLRPELTLIPILVQSVAWLTAVIILGVSSASLPLYGWSFLGCAVLQVAATVMASRNLTTISFAGARRTVMHLLRLAWPLGLAGLFVTSYYRLDGIILFHYRGAVANAYYSAGYRILDTLQILPATLSGMLLPLLAAVTRDRRRTTQGDRVFELVLRLTLVAALPTVTLGIVYAPQIVQTLYGSSYARAVPLTRILLAAFIPISIAYAAASVMIANHLLRPYVLLTGSVAAVNLLANMITIPRFGAVAAAWSTLGTELLVAASMFAVIGRRKLLLVPTGGLIRCGLAVIPSTVVAVLMHPLPIWLSLAAALLTYPPSVWLIRSLTFKDISDLIATRKVVQA